MAGRQNISFLTWSHMSNLLRFWEKKLCVKNLDARVSISPKSSYTTSNEIMRPVMRKLTVFSNVSTTRFHRFWTQCTKRNEMSFYISQGSCEPVVFSILVLYLGILAEIAKSQCKYFQFVANLLDKTDKILISTSHV